MARVRFLEHTGVALGRARRPDIPEAGAASGATRLLRRALSVSRCRRGAYLLEFAFIAPALIPVLMGMVEIAWQFRVSVAVDHAALEASRYASLGRDDGDGKHVGSACPADIKAAAIKAAGGMLVADRLTLTPTQFGTASSMRTRTGGTSGTGTGGSYVEYRLEYRQRYIVASKLFGASEVTHVATTTVMNEPYPNAPKPKAC